MDLTDQQGHEGSPRRPGSRTRDSAAPATGLFRRVCQRAKIAGVTPQTLQHTFASRLVMAGVDLRTVQELGSWQTIAMVERYSHLSPAHKAQAVERIAWAPSPEVGSSRDGLHVGADPEPVLVAAR